MRLLVTKSKMEAEISAMKNIITICMMNSNQMDMVGNLSGTDVKNKSGTNIPIKASMTENLTNGRRAGE